VRYLGLEVDKAIEVAEQIDIGVAKAISLSGRVGADDFAADPELPKTAFVCANLPFGGLPSFRRWATVVGGRTVQELAVAEVSCQKSTSQSPKPNSRMVSGEGYAGRLGKQTRVA
jgi:hypothetical protein